MTVDLGALMWLDNMRIASASGISRDRGTFIEGYILRGSDGSRDATGALKWHRVSPQGRQDNLIDRFAFISDIYDPPQKLRYLEMRNTSTELRVGGYGFNLGEILLFSEGYMSEATLTSDIIPPARTAYSGSRPLEPRFRRIAAGNGGGNPHAHRRPDSGADPLYRLGRLRENQRRMGGLARKIQEPHRYFPGRGRWLEPVEPQIPAAGRPRNLPQPAAVHADPGQIDHSGPPSRRQH